MEDRLSRSSAGLASPDEQRRRLEPLGPISIGNRLARLIWGACWLLLCRWTPRPLHGWRRIVLRRFGADIGAGAHVYPDVRIWAPWNLQMGPKSCLADGVHCYNVAQVTLEGNALVSQRAFLCTASHDFDDLEFPLIGAPIKIGASAWVAAEAFIAPGVTVQNSAVVLARAVVTSDIEQNTVVGGNPARIIRKRKISRAT